MSCPEQFVARDGRPGTARIVLAVMMAGFGGLSRADEFSVAPSVALRVSRSDNIDLTPVDATAVNGVALTTTVRAAQRTESRELSADLSVSGWRYDGQRQRDRTDTTVGLAFLQRAELGQWNLGLRDVRDSTLNSELTMTGIPQVRRQRRSSFLVAAWEQNLDETMAVSVAANLGRVRYEAGPGLVDYNDDSLTVSLNKALAERWTVGAGLGGERYRTLDDNVRSTSHQLFLTAKYLASERLSVNLQAGRQQTDTVEQINVGSCSFGSPIICLILSNFTSAYDTFTTVPLKFINRGMTYSGSAEYAYQTGNLRLTAVRSLSSTANATQARTTSASGALTHRFSENLSGNLDASIVESRYLSDLGTGSRTSRLGAGITWRLDEWSEAGCGYTRIAQHSIADGSTARSNEIWVTFNHAFHPWAIGR